MNESHLMAGSPTSAPPSASAVAESILKSVAWTSETMGYCECPGKQFHSTSAGKRDCVIYLDRVPTIHCMHASCAAEITKINRQLRSAILNPNGNADFILPKLSAEEKTRIAERHRHERIRVRAAKSLPQILKKYRWTYDEILRDSPVNVKTDLADHWRLLLSKFNPTDVVWIGGVQDSGSPQCAANFKPAEEWLTYGAAPAQFICPVNFKNTSIARSNANIVDRRFLVIESDVLKKDEIGAVFRWLMQCELKLVAVVDTAGKSLHGWFDFTDCEPVLDELRLVLPAMGADPKLFTASQPVRLPGAERDGKLQRLVYLSDGEVSV
jgi:hypothetical protein